MMRTKRKRRSECGTARASGIGPKLGCSAVSIYKVMTSQELGYALFTIHNLFVSLKTHVMSCSTLSVRL
jgi:hypothetical protein